MHPAFATVRNQGDTDVLLAKMDLGERLCWTRMQAEAGEGLAKIIHRKNLERQAGDGLFFWGVGNAPSRAVPALARTSTPVDVLFSVMKSRPKARDVAPTALLAWRSYIDVDEVVKPLPEHVLITSRAGNRDYHYALVCNSDAPLDVSDYGPFDPTAFRNLGAGGAVGSSQVTALLERCAPDKSSAYRIAMRARLTGGLWVKLVDPIILNTEARRALDEPPDREAAWRSFVAFIRSNGQPLGRPCAEQPSLFPI